MGHSVYSVEGTAKTHKLDFLFFRLFIIHFETALQNEACNKYSISEFVVHVVKRQLNTRKYRHLSKNS